jgi:hypothetical protein
VQRAAEPAHKRFEQALAILNLLSDWRRMSLAVMSYQTGMLLLLRRRLRKNGRRGPPSLADKAASSRLGHALAKKCGLRITMP